MFVRASVRRQFARAAISPPPDTTNSPSAASSSSLSGAFWFFCCIRCGGSIAAAVEAVVVEEVPWGDGKRTLTRAYMLFLARWARRLSWKETAEAFRTSWDKVFDAVEHVVTFGLEHRVFGQIDAIGVDEIQYAKGHKYLTLVYQIDLGVTRLLWVGRERTIESFQGFFTVIGDELASKIVFVCSDMWEPYLKVIREKCSEALHILDRFHIVAKMNKALDEVRAGESRRMASEGRVPVLKKSRWLLLKREENLKTEQRFRLRDLLRYNLKTVRAYLLKEVFPATLGLQLRHMGGKVPRPMVPPGDALPHRADEEDRPFHARASRVDPELFPCSEAAFQRRRGGPEQQGQSKNSTAAAETWLIDGSASAATVAAMPRANSAPSSVGARKMGRNDPCLCGSGKKYKKCCGA